MARATEGSPEPLGVSLTASGVNVAVWSSHATAVEFCLFDAEGQAEVGRIALPGRTGAVFHGHIEGVVAGARYGLRAHGPYAPSQGHRFNPDKLLVDPYALALDRSFTLHPTMFGYRSGDPNGALPDDADSAPHTPKAIVTAYPAEWPNLPDPIPWGETVIYELHVRGFTKLHPDIPEAIRGTFAALAHPVAIDHLKRLGVTTVELMPCAAWVDERHLGPLGLTNYWGYNPIAMMAPDPRLAPGGWAEVRSATRALARAGIETVLDVVFNHTGEGDELGPTLSLRGLDNAGYYRLHPDDPARYVNDAGTGNILALDRPAGVRLAMDAMRAWRRFGGIAGFRFDLATVLGRRADGFDPDAPLICAIDQDPELRSLKLIAEPWDIGAGGYQLGGFPAAWGEWNDRFRDDVRGFWRGDGVSLGRLARRLSGSEDVFAHRRPSRSVNYAVAHDGFTLADLVSYESRHNLANGEQGRDGTGDNYSWNNGVEGASDDPSVRAARARDQRALLASLILARGTPMLAMGAELGQTQGGNNNAYAQDNATSWLDWSRADPELEAFTARLIDIRRRHPALRADRFLTGEAGGDVLCPDVAWRRADGHTPGPVDWDDPTGETLVMVLAEPDGEALDRVVVAIHRGRETAEATLPEPRNGFVWSLLADSADLARSEPLVADTLTLSPRSVVVLGETANARARPRPPQPVVLKRLARAAGIAPGWWDVEGARHAVDPDTERALLAAMGLPAETSQQALTSLHHLAETHERRALPYAVVRREGETVTLFLAAAEGEAAHHTWLTIEAENGRLTRLRAGLDNSFETAVHCRDGRTAQGLAVTLPALPVGRYQVRCEERPDTLCRLTIAPPTCYAPAGLRARRIGLTTQIYSLRREGDQGVGDFTTLGALGEASARQGAAVVGVNPMHALFNNRRDRASPYYPSDRRFLDPIYLDLDQVPGAGFDQAAARALSSRPLIDHPAVWALKRQALEASFVHGQPHPGLEVFVASGGPALSKFAAFEAIADAYPALSWSEWPTELRDPDGAGVRAFADAHRQEVRFHQYLQWLCEGQLTAAAERASGLELGFCRDLAIGAAPDGAEVWSQTRPGGAPGVSIGAPPDPLGPHGQVWGLPPFDPHALRADGYRSVAELFAANMRHAGALRIDHVMGLTRQFWVPDGAEGSDGAYVAYPLGDLLGQIALESVRARCLVIGEDLGTVPEGLRDTLARDGVLTYRVLPFERDGPGFLPPSAYPRLAWACVATHDLPPLAGWWDGIDIDERLALGLLTEPQALTAHTERAINRAALVEALSDAGVAARALDPDGPLTPDLAAAIHAFIATTPAVLAAAQVEDLAGEREPVNLPGTDRERANWRRRLETPLGDLFETPLARAILTAMRAARPTPDDQPASAKPS